MEYLVGGTALIWIMFVGLVALCCSNEETVNETATSVSPQELVQMMDANEDILILDVRTAEEYAVGHIAGSVNIPHREISYRLGELEEYRNKPVVVYCVVGGRAGLAEGTLREAGFTNLLDLTGHMTAWDSLGLPVARPEGG